MAMNSPDFFGEIMETYQLKWSRILLENFLETNEKSNLTFNHRQYKETKLIQNNFIDHIQTRF